MKKLLLVLFTFFFFCSFAQKQLLVLEGKDGFYVFVSSEVLSGKNITGVTKVVISRAERGGTFAEIGAATATLDIQKMKERFGQQFPQQIASMLRLKDEGMLIDYMKMHPQLEDYALLMFDLDFFQAAGAVYMDKYKPVAGATLKYKAKFLKADGSALSEQPEGEVTAGKLPVFPKPRFFSRTEGDSALTVKWLGKTGTGEPGYFGNVYRQQGKGEFTMVGQILPFTSNDSILYTWYDQVRPGSQYRYFIRVTNLVGLEGTASDTATLVSANFNNTVKLENFAVKDTTGGIYFSWKAQEPNPLYVGLAVERKTMREKDYHGIDTIPFTADSYLDARVIPNISYAYQFRPVNLRFTPLMPSANATALHRGGKVNTLIPTAISARPGKNGIEVKWRMVRHYNVNGYYVYRSINNSAYEQYSGLLNDTLFVDTSATNGRTLYTYKIATIDFADVIGGLSNPVQAKPANTILPQDVSGVLTTSEAGKIALRWNDMTRFDNYVRGYNVYRKAEREVITGVKTVDELKRSGFTKLNTQLVIPPVYSDNTAQGGTYTYAVTTVDIDGNESNISQLAEARPIEKRIAAPSYFSLLKTTAGVELRWDDELQKEVTDYAIYRRTREAENTTLLGKVKATQLKYTDATAVAGTFYFYSVKAQSATGESDFSTEKGIVK